MQFVCTIWNIPLKGNSFTHEDQFTSKRECYSTHENSFISSVALEELCLMMPWWCHQGYNYHHYHWLGDVSFATLPCEWGFGALCGGWARPARSSHHNPNNHWSMNCDLFLNLTLNQSLFDITIIFLTPYLCAEKVGLVVIKRNYKCPTSLFCLVLDLLCFNRFCMPPNTKETALMFFFHKSICA